MTSAFFANNSALARQYSPGSARVRTGRLVQTRAMDNRGFSMFPTLYRASVLLLCLLGTSTSKPLPNVLFVMVDDMGWNDIGYHNGDIQTPNIDALASEGVKLNNYYVGEVCVPSRSMMMTGRYAIHLGLQHNSLGNHPRSLPLDEVTIAEKLSEMGYATYIIGKWHCGFYREECLPFNRGFDSFFGYVTSVSDHYNHSVQGLWALQRNSENEGPLHVGHYSTHLYTEEAEKIIRDHDPEKPLFMYLAYGSNHEPLAVPPEYVEQYMSIEDVTRRTVAGMIACVDEGIGNLTKALKKKGLDENTIIVFSSDNGGDTDFGGSNWPLKGQKATLWEGGVRVPSFISSPLLSRSVRGSVYDGLMHITDWFPTLLYLAGGTMPEKKLDGVNQWNSISEGVPCQREDALLNINPTKVAKNLHDPSAFSDNPYFDIRIQAAIRVGDWKLLTGPTANTHWVAPPEDPDVEIPKEDDVADCQHVYLYNIAEDPKEIHNLAAENQEKVLELLKRLGEHHETCVPPQTQTEPKINFEVMGDSWKPWV